MIRDATGSGGPVAALSFRAVLQSGGGEEQDMPGEAPRQAGQAVSGRDSDSGIAARAGGNGCRVPAAGPLEIACAGPCSGLPRLRRCSPPASAHAQETPGTFALLLRHRRSDAACDVRRRHGRGTAVGDLPDPRARPHGGRECRAAQPRRRSQRRAAALRGAAQSARPARRRLEQRQTEAGADRHAARRKRRARRARRPSWPSAAG